MNTIENQKAALRALGDEFEAVTASKAYSGFDFLLTVIALLVLVCSPAIVALTYKAAF